MKKVILTATLFLGLVSSSTTQASVFDRLGSHGSYVRGITEALVPFGVYHGLRWFERFSEDVVYGSAWSSAFALAVYHNADRRLTFRDVMKQAAGAVVGFSLYTLSDDIW